MLNFGGIFIIILIYEKDDFVINVDILEVVIIDKMKVLILNLFNNFIGVVFLLEIFEKIVNLVKKYDFFILLDEVYDGFSFYEDFVLMVKFVLDYMIIFGSMFKNFVMIGWCLGYMIVFIYLNEVVKIINEGIIYLVFILF